jgi:hypothetical protein
MLALIAAATACLVAAPPRAQTQAAPVAQADGPTLPAPRAGRRIEIRPRPLLYRRCVDWYELQNRPSGTVLFPEMRCRWVRG